MILNYLLILTLQMTDMSQVNGTADSCNMAENESVLALGEMDLHTAARHGTRPTLERLCGMSGACRETARLLQRGVVDSTPGHNAAAAGNVVALEWLMEGCTGDERSPVYDALTA